jgi:hypothetical protein
MSTAVGRDVATLWVSPHLSRHWMVPAPIGPDLFRAACNVGLEGLVSKRRDRPYQAGRSKHWLKVKNRKHPAMSRVAEALRAT